MMRAFVWTDYGPATVLKLQEVAKPVVKDKTILIKVKASGLTAGDCQMRSMNFPRSTQFLMRISVALSPGVKILGQQFSGEVEAVGRSVTKFKPGELVFGAGDLIGGAEAEYIAIEETPHKLFLAHKPEHLSFAEAAVCPINGSETIAFLKAGNIKKNSNVLIIGAAGNMGTFAIQVAKKHFGAARVVAVDSGDKKIEFLKSLGADRVIDYKREDYLKTNTETFDVILDVLGIADEKELRKHLASSGKIVLGMSGLGRIFKTYFKWDSQIVCSLQDAVDEFETLITLLASNTVKPVLDRTFKFEETIEAHKCQESWNKVGNIAVIRD